MKLIISDTNILIDLIRLELIDVFFQLENLALKTTDFVFEELFEEQKLVFSIFINDGKFEILESFEDDLLQIMDIQARTSGLSFEDCSVWYFAEKLNGILLTGDGKLRRQSSLNGVEVKGILFVFDILLLQNKITFEDAIDKLNQLYQLNTRLPTVPKNQRIEFWSKRQHID
ncbi:PIN domain-containing protein [Arcicella rigui]|uniref:PIN domain-containing protein n=1 Tax=Arcicella rigui TaxID=797020 RepID=A0ABU5QDH6_9BACT|nr:hypothetical protein [Arcicella rigui]MEA5140409.1 hypothetical protein [Arcicella rigui]